jgi:hypothetical protein
MGTTQGIGKVSNMSPSPTFIANFSDGEQTRMTVWCRNGLDVARGVKLARYAYESRRKGKTPPPMTSATFVSAHDGAVLSEYNADELAEHESKI